MRGFYGIQPRGRNALKATASRNVNPTSPDNRLWSTDLGGGFTREDTGAPPVRLQSETQPISQGTIGGPVIALIEPSPVEVEQPTPRGPIPHKLPSSNWQREFGLGK